MFTQLSDLYGKTVKVAANKLYLCGGLQSSGSTLVSWCFLQRGDMNGVLDGENDLLPQIDSGLGTPFAWYKTTVSCFRLSELAWHYQNQGWEVHPLLVVRDVRKVWESLLKKPYACDGITAEDPPLRLRLFRFNEDWSLFRRMGWPVLRYESLVESPEGTLRSACRALGLPWDPSMVTWPKSVCEIADGTWGSESFRGTRGNNLKDTLAQRAKAKPLAISKEDLAWLERTFRAFNVDNNYPTNVQNDAPAMHQKPSAPSFQVTRRYEWETRRKPLRWLLSRFGVPYRKLIERRSHKRAA
jgi:hypothetical protein